MQYDDHMADDPTERPASPPNLMQPEDHDEGLRKYNLVMPNGDAAEITKPLATAVEPYRLRSYLSRRYLLHGGARNVFNAMLKRWLCHCINADLEHVDFQNSMAEAAARGYRGMIVKYKCDPILKCRATHNSGAFPTEEEFQLNYPEMGSLVYMIRSNRPCAKTPFVEKFSQKTEQGETKSKTLHVVLMWADVLTLVPDDLWSKLWITTRTFLDTDKFRAFCGIPCVKDVPNLGDVVITGPIARRLLSESYDSRTSGGSGLAHPPPNAFGGGGGSPA